MDFLVFSVVLCAALMHASWNAIVKNVPDKTAMMTAITLGHLVPAVAIMVVLPLPSFAEIPFLLSGAVLRIGYQFLLIRAYHMTDLSAVYPIARGFVPLNISLLSVGLFAERLSLQQYGAMALILLGLFAMAWRSNLDRKSVSTALLTSGFITAYSLSDAWGARSAIHPVTFYGWLSALNAVLFVASISVSPQRGALKRAFRLWHFGLLGGLLSFGAYALVIWSYTKAPLALVSALRESSIIFAALIAILFLGERPTRQHLIGVVFVALGAISLRFVNS